MKKVLALSALIGMFAVGNAFALPVNNRPSDIIPNPSSDPSELTLQQILDQRVNTPSNTPGKYNAVSSQSNQAIWSVNDAGSRSFLISLFTAHGNGTFGIYSETTGETIGLINPGSGGTSLAFTVADGYLLDGTDQLLTPNFFGSTFGFFWRDNVEGYTAYTEDTKNGGTARSLVYQLDNETKVLRQGPSGLTTVTTDGNDDWLMSFEDHPDGDFDYNDATFFVKDITPVPEPGTMLLLGAGFLGLAIYGKRRRNA